MKYEIDITSELNHSMKKDTENCKIVVENQKIFLEFKFKNSISRKEQIKLVEFIAEGIAKNNIDNDILKDISAIRILE